MKDPSTHKPLISNVSVELLELLASAHAPAGGSVLFRVGKGNKDLRLVRHEGEPVTVEYCHSLVTKPREYVVVSSLPTPVESINLAEGVTKHLGSSSPSHLSQQIVNAMVRDAVDAAR
jgi:hypothetical protein